MLGWIASLFTGGLAKQLAAAFVQKQNADVDKDRIRADVKIEEIKERIAQRNKTLGSTIGLIMQSLFALPMVIYLNKVVVYDKVLELGATDDLSANLWQVFYIVLGGYFVLKVTDLFRK